MDRLITVIGSYAVGMTIKTNRFPLSGETVPGYGFSVLHGGKGSNQAVAAARLGGNVFYYTCVGKDSYGKDAIMLYEQEGVDASAVKLSENMSTGVGMVAVNKSGENQIIIDIGANNDIGAADIDKIVPAIKKSSYVLMQLEINIDAVSYIAALTKEMGIPFILNPAPFHPLTSGVLKCCDFIIPNETEARLLLGLAPDDPCSNEMLAEKLLSQGVKTAVITLGSKGALIADETKCEYVDGKKVNAVDTTGAGDTFSAAFTVALSEGKKVREAVEFANCAAALSVTKYGVVPSLPTRAAVDKFMQENGYI